MKNKTINFITKNKFLIMIVVMLMLITVFIIPIYAVAPKHIVYGQMQAGYIENVDETNFNEVYKGNYPNARVYDKKTINLSAIDVLTSNLLVTNHIGIPKFIITRDDSADAPKVAYEAVMYNNYSDQKVYDAINKIDFMVNSSADVHSYSTIVEFYNRSTKSVLIDKNDRTIFNATKIYFTIKITINSSMIISDNILNDPSIVFEGLDIDAELDRYNDKYNPDK